MDKAVKTRMLMENFNKYATKTQKTASKKVLKEGDFKDGWESSHEWINGIGAIRDFGKHLSLEVAPKYKDAFEHGQTLHEFIEERWFNYVDDVHQGKVGEKLNYWSNWILEAVVDGYYYYYNHYNSKICDDDVKKLHISLLNTIELLRKISNNQLFSNTELVNKLKSKLSK